jgi:probable rRNA maturation factor
VRLRAERDLGDMYISLPYVQQQCDDPEKDEIISLETRMPILLAHGLCHLMGYVSAAHSTTA